MESLAELRARREFECRLTPDRALESLDQAEMFLDERGMLTRTPDCALPSLYAACHERPYRPGRPGFASWPATKWPWFGELTERGHLVVAVHGGKNLLVSAAIAGLLDPICRAEIARIRVAGGGQARLLDHLAAAGPSDIDDLRTELRLTRQELTALRRPLARCGAIVSRSQEVTAGRGHLHSSELARWDQVYRSTGGAGMTVAVAGDPRRAFAELIVAGVRAAVLASEPELARWFAWPWYWTETLVDGLVGGGRLRRINGHVAAGPSQALR